MQQGRAAILLCWARRPVIASEVSEVVVASRQGVPDRERGGRSTHRACAAPDVGVALAGSAALRARGRAARRLHDGSKKVDK